MATSSIRTLSNSFRAGAAVQPGARIAKRGNRVYVDAMQNAKGKHSVPPYVLRATPAASVSMPLEWRELTGKLSPAKFDLKAALKRIEGQKKDPLEALAW